MAYRGMSHVLRTVRSTITRQHSRKFLHKTAKISSSVLRRHYTNQAENRHDILSQQTTLNSVRTNQTWKNKKPALVIFDKDGTLICFHSMWFPWLQNFTKKLCAVTGLYLEDKTFDLLGYCKINKKFIPGLLAQSTKPIIIEEFTQLLVQEGYSRNEAESIIKDVYEEGDTSSPETLKALMDIEMLFKILKAHNVKIALSTADSREGTLQTLKEFNLEKYVDHVVCGDDPEIIPKPSPYSAFKICSQLGVDPSETVMVGDTMADVGMGKAAKVGWNIGVLSGVGNSSHLMPDADHVIHSITDLLPLILPEEEWRQYYKYKTSERIMMEPHNLDEEVHDPATLEAVVKDDIQLVIFDLHGTLVCTHSRYAMWLDTLCRRIDQMTGLELTPFVYDKLGVNENKKLKQGILSEGTMSQVKSGLTEVLMDNGLTYEESLLVVNQTWNQCSYLLQTNTQPSDLEAKTLFKMLKQNGTKIALCTGDYRESALSDLDTLGLLKYVDMMVCGDDPHAQPKPSAHNVLLICKEFNVDPKNTVLIGDTMADMVMAAAANVFKKIGVLNGAGDEESLKKHADHTVLKVGGVMEHLFQSPQKISARSYSTIAGSSQSVLTELNSPQRRNFSTTSSRNSSSVPSYDYVIVGGGSAGCTLANRLTENSENKVLLMEAGPKDNSWKIWMPAALMYNLCDDKYNWYYHTEPEPNCNNRVMYWPRGRTLGGSSALNAMVYIRGNALDYDRWEGEGATGWSYASCLPYFKKSQCHELGENEYRGGSGPLHVSRGITNNPLHAAFIEAGQQAGYPFTDDMNGYQQEGVGWMDMTIHKGWRWSAAEAYLHPIKSRTNLVTKVKVLATRVLFDNHRAVGIEYTENGQVKKAMANKEVILSGGAINSPQLLMLSGVGNADDLKKLDIPVVAHLPGVGENLQDHLEMYVQQKCTQPITLYSAQWKFPHNMVKIGLQWGLTRTGWGATTHLETGGFIRSRPGVEHPDLQYHFLPAVMNDHGRKSGDCHAYQVHIGPMRPTSRGYLKLKSRDPKEHPKIVANYLSTEGDMQEFRDALRLTREIFAQKAFSEFCGGELQPGVDVQSPSQVDEFIRNFSDSDYHPSCTNKMGQPCDPMAVVDPETKVIGLEGLRVVDASIMPSIVSGNLNGTTIMMAEKAADIIKGVPPLPKSNAPVYKPKTLDTQR